MHIVTAATDDYVPHAAAMLHSVFENNPGRAVSVHLLHRPGLGAAHVQRLDELCRRHGATLVAREVPRAVLAGLPIAGRYPEEAWYRVALPALLPALDRALWLDADLITLSGLDELWNLDLGNKPLAACPNAMMFDSKETPAQLGVTDRRQYFNTGVLLMNLRQLRDEDSESALRAAALRYAASIRFADQDVLNAVYHDRYVRLELAWNVLSHTYINIPESRRVHGEREFEVAMRSPRIVHFTGRPMLKPWTYRCAHPHRSAYLRHRALAGWPLEEFPDQSLKNAVLRHLPMRVSAVLGALRRRAVREAMSYVRAW